jgi:hypothetical protein
MFPGRRSDAGGMFAAGDDVITENHWQGTSAQSGEHLTRDICYIFHFVDGKVTEQREHGWPAPRRAAGTRTSTAHPDAGWPMEPGRTARARSGCHELSTTMPSSVWPAIPDQLSTYLAGRVAGADRSGNKGGGAGLSCFVVLHFTRGYGGSILQLQEASSHKESDVVKGLRWCRPGRQRSSKGTDPCGGFRAVATRTASDRPARSRSGIGTAH